MRIVYLLDEPDSHLEQSSIESYMKIIQNDLSKKFKIKVILSTHNINTVTFFNDKLVFSCKQGNDDDYVDEVNVNNQINLY